MAFVRHFWPVLEPNTVLVEGWTLEAICLHLEAVTRGEITRLLINVPPGFMKSLLVNVFWPAWEWGAMGLPHMRYVTFSYAASLTVRDNERFRDLIISLEYQDLYGHVFRTRKIGAEKVSNSKTGWKLASSIGGVGTGERGDRVLLDDPHNVKESESDTVRNETTRWFRESLSSRFNDMMTSACVVIMQRVHEEDVSGVIIQHFPDYVHLMIPMEYDSGRHCETAFWSDPRGEYEDPDGILAWPERFPPAVVIRMKSEMGPYAYAAQAQQSPEPRGGGIFKRAWWRVFESPDGKFPPFEYIVGSLDTAYTEKQENDWSALTVWGTFKDDNKNAKIMLISAWKKRLPIHGETVDRMPKETTAAYMLRAMPEWGLVEWVAYTCNRTKVDRLLIEAAAAGISCAQELRRLHATDGWAVQLIPPKGDKVARAHAVSHVWSEGLIYAPDREWATMVIDEMAVFPKAPHDDITDSATQAIKHLRDLGLAVRREEFDAEVVEAMMHKGKKPQPLYPA